MNEFYLGNLLLQAGRLEYSERVKSATTEMGIEHNDSESSFTRMYLYTSNILQFLWLLRSIECIDLNNVLKWIFSGIHWMVSHGMGAFGIHHVSLDFCPRIFLLTTELENTTKYFWALSYLERPHARIYIFPASSFICVHKSINWGTISSKTIEPTVWGAWHVQGVYEASFILEMKQHPQIFCLLKDSFDRKNTLL